MRGKAPFAVLREFLVSTPTPALPTRGRERVGFAARICGNKNPPHPAAATFSPWGEGAKGKASCTRPAAGRGNQVAYDMLLPDTGFD